jgi:transposase
MHRSRNGRTASPREREVHLESHVHGKRACVVWEGAEGKGLATAPRPPPTSLEARAREVNRVQKVLEGANIKLSSVATDVLGKSGRAMLEALIAGEQDPARLSELARGRMRSKRPELQRALDGRLLGQHRILLQHLLAHIDFLDQSIAELEAEIERCLAPFGQAVALAQTLPGEARDGGHRHHCRVGHRHEPL